MDFRVLLSVTLCLSGAGALAQPVKCLDAKGKVQYIDKSLAEAQNLKCDKVRAETSTVNMQPGAIDLNQKPKPAADTTDSRAALAAAERKLAEARAKLAEQESIRSGNERNYARVEERLAPFQAAVKQAEQEVEKARRNGR